MNLLCPMCNRPFVEHTKTMGDLTGDPNEERILCSDTSFGPMDIIKLADAAMTAMLPPAVRSVVHSHILSDLHTPPEEIPALIDVSYGAITADEAIAEVGIRALVPDMEEAILAWGRGLEHMVQKPIPSGEALLRAIEGANGVDALLLPLVVRLRQIRGTR
jgi:hypothetical protein